MHKKEKDLNHTPRPIVVWAHRGDSHHAPENTREAFRLGRQKGFAIETDAWLSADGVPVLWHDETLLRCTGNPRPISSYRYDELTKISGAPEGEPHAPIISVDEFFQLVTSGLISIDFKANNLELVEKIAEIVKSYDRIDDVIFGSFHHETLVHIRKILPGARTSFSPREVKTIGVRHFLMLPWGSIPKRGVSLMLPQTLGGHFWMTKRFVRHAHRLGLGVHVWTVNDTETALRLAALGVDGIMSDNPQLIVDALTKHGYKQVDNLLCGPCMA